MNLRTKFCPQYGQNGFNQSQFAFPSFASNKAAEHDRNFEASVSKNVSKIADTFTAPASHRAGTLTAP
jgi:hypothetical protein